MPTSLPSWMPLPFMSLYSVPEMLPVPLPILPAAIAANISAVWCCTLQKLAPLYPPGDAGDGSKRKRLRKRVI